VLVGDMLRDSAKLWDLLKVVLEENDWLGELENDMDALVVRVKL
jgi:hypothetical protein